MARQLVKITVNGQEVEASAGDLLLNALRDVGVRVPTLCHDERLTPYGGCRLCVVERKDGRGGMVPSCSTPVLPGMVIESDTQAVLESRRRQLQFLVANHRMECPVCDRRGDCRFQDLIYEYGAPEDQLPFELIRRPRVDNSPVIARDPEKCIICGKCARLCEEVQGVAAIGIVNRGLDAHVTTHLDQPLDCEFCGQCVNACPVGALILDTPAKQIPVWLRSERATTCSYCSCGCQISTQVHDGEVLKVGGDESAEPNRGKLCVKGWLGWDVLTSEERLTTPMVRRGGRLVEASWDEALSAAVKAIETARTKRGGDGIVGLGTARLTNEDAYLFQRIWRGGIGSPHVGIGPTGGVAGYGEGLDTRPGRPSGTATFEDLRAADLVFVLRGDPTRTHPLVKTEIVQGVRQREQKLVIANTISGGLEDHASLHVALPPAGESALLRAVSARVLDRRPDLRTALAERAGFEAWAESLSAWRPSAAGELLAISETTIDLIVDHLLAARSIVSVVVTSSGLPGDEGAVTADAARLAEVLAEDSVRTSGLLLLGERVNVRGVLDAGLHPAVLPGWRPVLDEGARAAVEQAWGVSAPAREGFGPKELSERAAAGEVDLLYLAGQDPLSSWPRALKAESMLSAAGAVIVQDAFLSPTARLADVVLPVRMLAERDGTVIALDGEPRPLHPVVEPPVPLPQDGDLLREIARRLGIEVPDASALAAELAGLVSWPAEEPSSARFAPVDAPTATGSATGLLLDLSPILFHSGTTTHYSERLCELAPLVALRMEPEDAASLGVQSGQLVRVSASEGEALLRARVDHNVTPGTVVATSTNGREKATSLLELNGDNKRVTVRRSE
jgi:predicted molibdopterin-dependent oxidoreductase YjgC